MNHVFLLQYRNYIFLKKYMKASRLDLLSIPHRGENVKTLRWDRSLQRQNIFMAIFKRVV